MTIREKGYAHWTGKLEDRKYPWWPITRMGIKLAFKTKGFRLFFIFSLIPSVVYLAGIYISERIESFRFMIKGSEKILQINHGYFKSYLTGDFLLFMIVMLLVFGGARLISDDLKNNSLQLYFSRPIQKKDYFLGKASVLFFFLLILTLVPGLVFFLMKLIFSGSFQFFVAYPWLPLSIIVYSALVTAFFSSYTLLLSSLSKNRRYVAILTFTVYIFSDVVFGIFYGIFRSPYVALLSLKLNLQQVGAFLFRQKATYDVPWFYSLLVLLAVCVLAAVVLRKKIKGVEVIK
jgi:ABC-type transport system involved in multi-copper enzyme maturation permease subunit